MNKLINRSFITFIISTFLLIIYIIADIFFRDAAFEDSNMFTIKLQNKIGSKSTDIFFIIFCDILHPVVAGVLLVLFYVLAPNKIKTLSFVIYFLIVTYICSLLKIFYHGARPYWTDKEIEAKECYSEYGNPSGHSMASIISFGMVWIRYIYVWVKEGETSFYKKNNNLENKAPINNVLINSQTSESYPDTINLSLENSEFEKKNNNGNQKNGVFIVMSSIILLIVFFILFGRIYLGMHSYNEVLLGFVYGLYFLIIYYLYVEKFLMNLLEKIIIKNNESIKNGKLIYLPYFIINTMIYLIVIIIPLIVFKIADSTIDIDPNWNKIIDKACGFNLFKTYYFKCFSDSGIISGVFGVFYGIIFTRGEYYTLKYVYNKEKVKSLVNQIDNSWIKQIARIIIVFVVCGIFASIVAFIPDKDNIYIEYFVNINLALLLASFAIIRVIPFAYYKLKIEIKGDLLKYNNNTMTIHTGEELTFNPSDINKN